MTPPGGPGSLALAEDDISQSSILVQWIITFISYLRNIYKTSDIVSGKLLNFFYILSGLLGQFSTVCKALALQLPGSVYKLHQYTGLEVLVSFSKNMLLAVAVIKFIIIFTNVVVMNQVGNVHILTSLIILMSVGDNLVVLVL